MRTWDDIAKTFNERICIAIKEKNITTRQFAELAGLTANTIYGCKYRNRLPNSSTVAAICEAHDLSADWLLGLKEENKR